MRRLRFAALLTTLRAVGVGVAQTIRQAATRVQSLYFWWQDWWDWFNLRKPRCAYCGTINRGGALICKNSQCRHVLFPGAVCSRGHGAENSPSVTACSVCGGNIVARGDRKPASPRLYRILFVGLTSFIALELVRSLTAVSLGGQLADILPLVEVVLVGALYISVILFGIWLMVRPVLSPILRFLPLPPFMKSGRGLVSTVGLVLWAVWQVVMGVIGLIAWTLCLTPPSTSPPRRRR